MISSIDLWQASQRGFRKQDTLLCLKVNMRQRKCHVNCIGRNVWASGKYIMKEVFDPRG